MQNVLTQLKRFAQNTKGSISVEAVIILPILLWAVTALAVSFDLFRTKSNLEKATFTVSDALSRETNAITPDYVTNAHTLVKELAGLNENASLRVSVLTWHQSTAEYVLKWSEIRGDHFQALTQADMLTIKDRLPNMANQDTLIVVESQFTYDPIYNIGLFTSSSDGSGDPAASSGVGVQNLKTFVFTRPRYAPQLVFSTS